MRDWLICGHVALDKCNVYPAPQLAHRNKMARL